MAFESKDIDKIIKIFWQINLGASPFNMWNFNQFLMEF